MHRWMNSRTRAFAMAVLLRLLFSSYLGLEEPEDHLTGPSSRFM